MNSDEEASKVPLGTKVRVTNFMNAPYEDVTGTLVAQKLKSMGRGTWYMVKIENAAPHTNLVIGEEFPCQWSEFEPLEETT